MPLCLLVSRDRGEEVQKNPAKAGFSFGARMRAQDSSLNKSLAMRLAAASS